MRHLQRPHLVIPLFIIAIVFLVYCGDDKGTNPSPSVPIVTTSNIEAITQTTVISGGKYVTDSNMTIMNCGICWSSNPNPTIDNDTTADSTLFFDDTLRTGYFNSVITGLTPNTLYYVRAYAKCNTGTGYGNLTSFTTASSPGTVTDIDGNIYQTVLIGDQLWMAENLRVTHYRNGDSISLATNDAEWVLGSFYKWERYRHYDDDTNNTAVYGPLYNWHAVTDDRGLAPEGWHIPSDEEWKQLEMYLGMSQADADATGVRVSGSVGNKIMEPGTTHWIESAVGVSNESGFMALPAGLMCDPFICEGFRLLGSRCYFWSSSEGSPLPQDSSWFRGLIQSQPGILRDVIKKGYGFSIRCIKD